VAAALLGRGDDVLVEDPAYEPLYRGAEGLGAQVRRFRRDPAEGFCIDVGRIVDALTPNTKAVFLSNPHNPSGIMAPDEEVGALAAALAPRGVLLLVDEVYRELFVPGTTARRLGPNVVAVSSLTKCFGVGWARAGWVLAPPELADGLRAATMHVTGELPRMMCAVGAHGFGRIEELLARARAFGEGNRDRVDAFAAKHAADLAWTPPGRGAVFGVFEDRRGRDMGPIIEAGYQREGVLVVPGAFFGLPSAFRLSWTIGRAQIEEALARLERALGLVGA
jgi:aspartate/methionine/tyrosine aminotransferase